MANEAREARENCQFWQSQFVLAEEANDANEKKRCKDALNETKDILRKLTVKLENEINTTTNDDRNTAHTSAVKRQYQIKSIRDALSNITFTGETIQQTCKFIDKMDKIYAVTVLDVDPTLESDFLLAAKLNLGDMVYKNMASSGTSIKSFKEFKKWIKVTYGGRLNAYQLFQVGWDIPFNKTENFSKYAQTVSEELNVALVALREQHLAVKKCDLTVEALMEAMAAMLVCNNLRNSCFPIYRDMCNDMDKLLTAREMAAKAEFYRTRIGLNPVDETGIYWSNHDERNKEENSNPKYKYDKQKTQKYVKFGNNANKYNKNQNNSGFSNYKSGKPFQKKTFYKKEDKSNDTDNQCLAVVETREENIDDLTSVFAPETPFQN